MTAKWVLPFFQQAPYPPDDVDREDRELPEQLLNLAQAVLAGTGNAKAARNLASHGHERVVLLLNEARYAPLQYPFNAGYAAYATVAAVGEVTGYDQYHFMDSAQKVRWQRRGTPHLVLTDPLTEAEFEMGWGDTAGVAAVASACGYASDECEPEQLETFWDWWLREALPQAWEAVRGNCGYVEVIGHV